MRAAVVSDPPAREGDSSASPGSIPCPGVRSLDVLSDTAAVGSIGVMLLVLESFRSRLDVNKVASMPSSFVCDLPPSLPPSSSSTEYCTAEPARLLSGICAGERRSLLLFLLFEFELSIFSRPFPLMSAVAALLPLLLLPRLLLLVALGGRFVAAAAAFAVAGTSNAPSVGLVPRELLASASESLRVSTAATLALALLL